VDEVVREVELESDAERAWRAITEESELSEWIGGEVEIDLEPGGEITVSGEDDDRSGFVESVDEGRSLSFWWSEEGEESSRVEFEIIDQPEKQGCTVRVTETKPLAGLERELADITACAAA
jgi:uncharacterized protein YndB with AHSA1/START domain